MKLKDRLKTFAGKIAAWFRRKKNISGEQNQKQEKQWKYNSSNPRVKIAQDIVTQLKGKNLEHLLLQDYELPMDLLLSEYMTADDDERTRRMLVDLLYDMLDYLKTPGHLKLRLTYQNTREAGRGKGRSGEYKCGNGERVITLMGKKGYRMYNLYAILCHELSHYFMEYYGLSIEDEELNEVRTDITANLIGFSGIMEKGYREIVEVQPTFNGTTTWTQKIGYISDTDCGEIRQYILALRDRNKMKEKERELRDKAAADLEQHIELARMLKDQLYIISPGADRNIKFESPERFQEFQKALMEYESRDLNRELERFEEAAAKLSHKHIVSADREVQRLCEDMLRWSRNFQGIEV